jgi:hypothetical protein
MTNESEASRDPAYRRITLKNEELQKTPNADADRIL